MGVENGHKALHYPQLICYELRKKRRRTKMAVKIGINGFGRIGRNVFKIIT